MGIQYLIDTNISETFPLKSVFLNPQIKRNEIPIYCIGMCRIYWPNKILDSYGRPHYSMDRAFVVQIVSFLNQPTKCKEENSSKLQD